MSDSDRPDLRCPDFERVELSPVEHVGTTILTVTAA